MNHREAHLLCNPSEAVATRGILQCPQKASSARKGCPQTLQHCAGALARGSESTVTIDPELTVEISSDGCISSRISLLSSFRASLGSWFLSSAISAGTRTGLSGDV